DEVRATINRIDQEIVRLLAERGGYVRQAARFKQTTDDVRAPARVEQVIGRVRALAEQFGRRLIGELTAVLFPSVAYSACPGKTSGHEGTIAIRPEVALAYLCDVLEGIVRSGFER